MSRSSGTGEVRPICASAGICFSTSASVPNGFSHRGSCAALLLCEPSGPAAPVTSELPSPVLVCEHADSSRHAAAAIIQRCMDWKPPDHGARATRQPPPAVNACTKYQPSAGVESVGKP